MVNSTPIITELELKQVALLNAVADAQHVDTTSLRKCEVSTTVNDIRYGTLTMKGEVHEACVVFFCFEIVGQNKSHTQRIQELDITLQLFRAPATEAEQIVAINSNTQNSSGSASLEIRHREPTHGKTVLSKQTLNSQTSFGAQAGYQSLGVNAGYSVSKQRDRQDFAYLESHLRSKRAVNFKLKENPMLEDGVPGRLECALVLKTDKLPFSIGVTFTAVIPFLGKLWKKTAEAKVVVGESFLRRGANVQGGDHPSLQQMESDGFLDWLHSKLRNDWIAE